MLTVREKAQCLSLSVGTVYALCERRELTHGRVSNDIRIVPAAKATEGVSETPSHLTPQATLAQAPRLELVRVAPSAFFPRGHTSVLNKGEHMATSDSVGTVAALWRFPVKSMLGEQVGEADVTKRGLVGDRAYALIDIETGKVVSGKSTKLFPDLLSCRASFVEPPQTVAQPPPVRLTLPNGVSVISDSPDVDAVLSRFFKRDVTLAPAAPEDFTIDQYHPDIEDLDPAGHRDTVVEQKLGSAFFDQVGMPSPVPVGSFFDLFPLSVLTTSTLDQLKELRPESQFDQRRFRMNVIVDTHEPGFVENDWIGRGLTVGDGLQLRIAMPDPRCVMTTLPQGDLPKDTEILRTLTRHNRVQVGAAGLFPCAGVYAVVESAGAVRAGDPVALT